MFRKLLRFIKKRLVLFFSNSVFYIQSSLLGVDINGSISIDGFILFKISKKGKLVIGDNFTLNSRRASNLVGITNRASFQIIKDGSFY